MKIDHIGIVVKSIEKGVDHWRNLFGYKPLTEIVENTRQKVKIIFLVKKGSGTIKLIEPTDKSSPVFLFAQRGGGLHHICFLCKDIDKGIEHMKANGARLIMPPQPGEAFDNNEIAFLLTEQNIPIELISTKRKARLISGLSDSLSI